MFVTKCAAEHVIKQHQNGGDELGDEMQYCKNEIYYLEEAQVTLQVILQSLLQL